MGDEDSPSRCCAALLALHADELADSCIEPPEALSFLTNPHTGLAFLFDVLAVVFVLAEEHISARAKLLFLRGVCLCLRAVRRHQSARRRLPSAFAFEQCVIDVRVAWMASRDGLPAGLPAGLPRLSHTKARGT